MGIRRPAYEIHRPAGAELATREAELSEHAAEIYRESRDRARTGGPLIVEGRVSTVDRPEMERILSTSAGSSGPREKDGETGYLHVGAYVYVPVR